MRQLIAAALSLTTFMPLSIHAATGQSKADLPYQQLRAVIGEPLDVDTNLLSVDAVYVARVSRASAGSVLAISIIPRADLAEEYPQWNEEHHPEWHLPDHPEYLMAPQVTALLEAVSTVQSLGGVVREQEVSVTSNMRGTWTTQYAHGFVTTLWYLGAEPRRAHRVDVLYFHRVVGRITELRQANRLYPFNVAVVDNNSYFVTGRALRRLRVGQRAVFLGAGPRE